MAREGEPTTKGGWDEELMRYGEEKFTLLKGCEGFGDRLQCLLQAIEYCKKTERTLIVDWEDEHWCHEERKGFDYYFSISGLKQIDLDDFRAITKEQGITSIYPKQWESRLTRPSKTEENYKSELTGENRNKIWSEITKGERPDIEETIAVQSGTGYRSFNIETMKLMGVKQWLKSYIRQHGAANNLIYETYNCVHLRGCSKPFMGTENDDTNYNIKMTKTWPTLNAYLTSVHNAYSEIEPKDKEIPTYIITDNRKLGEAWEKRFKTGIVIEQSCELFEKSGIHMISREKNRANGIRKETIMMETIRDFNIIMNAKNIINDGLSLFSVMAAKAAVADIQLVRLNAGEKGKN